MPSTTDNNISTPNDLDQFYEELVLTTSPEDVITPIEPLISILGSNTGRSNYSYSNLVSEISMPTTASSESSFRSLYSTASVGMPIAPPIINRNYLDNLTRTKLETAINMLSDICLEFITLAGGAPRDYYMNGIGWTGAKPVVDYDIFVFNSGDSFSSEALHIAGFEDISPLGDEDYDNSDNDDNVIIDSVYRCYYEDLELNIIITNQVTSEDIINNFGCSLSKFELDVETGQSKATKEARLSLMSRSLIFKPETSDHYKRKIKAYFPSFTERSYEQAAMYLIDKQIRSLPNET